MRHRTLCATLLAVAAFLVRPAHAQTVDAFDPSPNGTVRTIALQPDGKVLLGGVFTTVGALNRDRIVRLNSDGTVDVAFSIGADFEVYAIAVQADGKILVGGSFDNLTGTTGSAVRRGIGRFNTDGSVDSTFNPGLDAGGSVFAFAVQADGKIVVAGVFTHLGAGGTSAHANIGRLNADGTVDGSFGPSANANVKSIGLQPDGKLVLAGEFTTMNGVSRSKLARLNADGTLDAFDPGADSEVYAVAIQADGKIVVGGNFALLGGGGTGANPRAFIGRLNADGSIDAVFNPGASSSVFALALQADGQIIASGLFTTFGGSSRWRLARVSAAGVLDATFNPGAGLLVRALALQPDGRLVVGGDFTTIGGGTATTTRFRAARLVANIVPPTPLIVTGGTAITWQRGAGAPELDRVDFSWSNDGTAYTALGTGVRTIGGWEITGISVPAGANVRVRARGFYATGGGGNGSVSVTETQAPISDFNIIENGSFAGGSTANWLTFAVPDPTGGTFNVTGDTFQFYRTGSQATVFQNTGLPFPAGAPIRAGFQLGNADAARKRISVLIHDSDFSDLHVCTFWLPAGAPLATYVMRTHTTKTWSNATISFYAASVNGAGNTTGFYRVDDVTLRYDLASPLTDTLCEDPTRPTPPSGVNNGNIIANGNFSNGLVSWTTFGQIQSQLSSGVFEFVKLAGTPAGVVFQSTNQPQPTNQILTATFQLGNSSAVRKRVTVLLHDLSFSDLSACTFWLPPGQPLTAYRMRTFATAAWTNATLSVYPSTAGTEGWILLDNVTLVGTPPVAIVGTECAENPSSDPAP